MSGRQSCRGAEILEHEWTTRMRISGLVLADPLAWRAFMKRLRGRRARVRSPAGDFKIVFQYEEPHGSAIWPIFRGEHR
jgi:hypothetical protein